MFLRASTAPADFESVRTKPHAQFANQLSHCAFLFVILVNCSSEPSVTTQNLAQLLDSEEVLFCLAGSHRQTLMESGLSSRLGRELAATRETVEAMKRKEAKLGDEISAIYDAYDKTMAGIKVTLFKRWKCVVTIV